VDACGQTLAEMRQADDRRALAPHLLDYSVLQWWSSAYRDAYQHTVESLALLDEAGAENPYLSPAYWQSEIILPWGLLLLGEWGEALRAVRTRITRLEKNGDDRRAQAMRLYLAWIHLHAMDFPGVLAICASIFPALGDPTVTSGLRICRVLAGAAETALGRYARALEHLMTAREEMERQRVLRDWYWRMPLEAALTDLWLAQGDLARARPQAERFLQVTLATAERTWQALAWDAHARVAMAASSLARAHECLASALSITEGFEVPLAAWRVHATAAVVYAGTGNRVAVARHRARSRATILRLANSLAAEEPLRTTFLAAPAVAPILGDARTTMRRAVAPDDARTKSNV
jgi:tetratricopeptide (TPR) repeat protein